LNWAAEHIPNQLLIIQVETGPMGVPLLGYIPFIKKHDPVYPFKAMIKLSEIYGPVVGFYMGPTQPFISVCGYEAAKEALHNDDLIGRPYLPAQQERTFGKKLGSYQLKLF
jgi:methyl farnesoate epoxidase / farnesoate epoxidase